MEIGDFPLFLAADLGRRRKSSPFSWTLKENLLWVRSFETVEELRLALLEFKRQYKEQWILQRLGYRTPAQARKDACVAAEVAA